ncbi:MAG: phosphoglycerate dehydrogenase [Phycisphaerales bacterium]|jgi:D-3-phosphoglycerate dehydrogenase|nr:phosphoglycerate dehydrogenase [Phycisphaerales bacterium]
MKPIKILIADKLAPEGAAFLHTQEDVEVLVNTDLSESALVDTLTEVDGVIVRSAVKLPEETLKQVFSHADARLRGIARAGVGVDNIHLPTATSLGVAVMNSASASTITTAEHAFALMISLARNVSSSNAIFRSGGWDRGSFVGVQLAGRTLGIVGMGRIGQAMARRALVFGMEVIGFDPFMNEPTAMDGQVQMMQSFDELIERVDIVTFHVPRTEQTIGMLGHEQFAKCKNELLVVNAARGGIVDEEALVAALDEGKCAGAAIDVYLSEPPSEDHPFRNHPKVLCTPHLGASTIEAQEAVAVNACASLLQYLRGEGLESAVNAGGLDLELNTKQKSFVELAERMITLLGTVTNLAKTKEVTVKLRGPATVGKTDTVSRYTLVSLLQHCTDEPVSIINVTAMARELGVTASTVVGSPDAIDQLSITIDGDQPHVIEGTVHADGQPRVTNIDGRSFDMVPSGHMIALFNDDQPGMVGRVGSVLGESKVNIDEMVIGHGDKDGLAMMIIKLGAPATGDLLADLGSIEGVSKVASAEI